MNMGGPGDHWYTDLFSWNLAAFGEPTDSLIKDVQRYGGDALLRDGHPLARRLWEMWPHWGLVDEEGLRGLTAELQTLRHQLRVDAEAGGWEVQQPSARLCAERDGRQTAGGADVRRVG